MLYDGADEVTIHVIDLKARIEAITIAAGKTVYAYSQDEFLDSAKELRFPAVGIFYTGLATNGDRRAEAGELQFDLVVADDASSGCTTVDASGATTLLSLIRQALKTKTVETEKSWDFKTEVPFDLGEANKIGYIQRWTAIVTKV